jgi:hypothetical protein
MMEEPITKDNLSDFALLLEEKAKTYRAQGHENYAAKLDDASRTILDIVFPDSQEALHAAAAKIGEIDVWLKELDRKLDAGDFSAL